MEDISEVDAVGLGCSLERFNEWQEVYDIIDNLEPNDGQHEAKISNYEKDYYRFRFIVDQYKEQPHLLDPYLEEIVSKIIKIATASDVSDDKMHQAFKYFRLVTNVRGFKLILQYLPHARISDRESGWKRFGPLYAVAAILKHGKRLDLLPYAGKILKTVMSMDWKKEPYRLARLFAVKIIQRVGEYYANDN
ncbi:unnamed protein product [Nesidiocoris tenuis]|uniref:Uncharacterized protein n=1 Tax=Nesidiocoris tenuis TaxID=355587 RepID=A0A6H5G3Q6_9HEMI|nr:unnamed protein product [Nesidiocoris tenuis]CAA9997336.1 unnamed protein product [Nesidiocoris tenuis]